MTFSFLVLVFLHAVRAAAIVRGASGATSPDGRRQGEGA
jgi:hypothetical protein